MLKQSRVSGVIKDSAKLLDSVPGLTPSDKNSSVLRPESALSNKNLQVLASVNKSLADFYPEMEPFVHLTYQGDDVVMEYTYAEDSPGPFVNLLGFRFDTFTGNFAVEPNASSSYVVLVNLYDALIACDVRVNREDFKSLLEEFKAGNITFSEMWDGLPVGGVLSQTPDVVPAGAEEYLEVKDSVLVTFWEWLQGIIDTTTPESVSPNTMSNAESKRSDFNTDIKSNGLSGYARAEMFRSLVSAASFLARNVVVLPDKDLLNPRFVTPEAARLLLALNARRATSKPPDNMVNELSEDAEVDANAYRISATGLYSIALGRDTKSDLPDEVIQALNIMDLYGDTGVAEAFLEAIESDAIVEESVARIIRDNPQSALTALLPPNTVKRMSEGIKALQQDPKAKVFAGYTPMRIDVGSPHSDVYTHGRGAEYTPASGISGGFVRVVPILRRYVDVLERLWKEGTNSAPTPPVAGQTQAPVKQP